MKKHSTLISLVLIVILISGNTYSRDEKVINRKDTLPKDPAGVYCELDNGLTYYIRENEKPEERVDMRLVVNAGSILEDEDQLGLAHFLEHMSFSGTKNFEKN